MKVTVEGLVTSIAEKTKDEKKYTELFLVQGGEREQVNVRLQGHIGERFEELEKVSFTGRLMTWRQREGIGSMVMAEI